MLNMYTAGLFNEPTPIDILSMSQSQLEEYMKNLHESLEYERKKAEILENHPYAISQEKSGKWYTRIPDITAKDGRRKVKRTKREDLIDYLVSYYIDLEENGGLSPAERHRKEMQNASLKQLFPEWIKDKELHTNASSYIARIVADWNRFYVPQETFINKPLKEFTSKDFDTWAHEMVKTHNLTKKQYYNMTVIIRQSLDYAVAMSYLPQNEFGGFKIKSSLFRKVKKPESKTQVYFKDEEESLIKDMFRRFNEKPFDTSPLMIILAFELGTRIGEILALKTTDIVKGGNYIHVQRQCVRDYGEFEADDLDNFHMSLKGFRIVEYTKSDDGDREIPLTDSAKKIIEAALAVNEKYGYYDDDFIFVGKKGRKNHYAVVSRITRGCEKVGIDVKSSHKIRKTFISKLIDAELNINTIRKYAGHADERTTYRCYCFDTTSEVETETKFENALKKADDMFYYNALIERPNRPLDTL